MVWVGDPSNGVECQVMRAQVHHGRDDPTSQPEASVASLELVGALPPEAVIGARVGLDAVVGPLRIPRFEGEITDLAIAFDSVDVPVPRIIAAGDLGRIGRRVVGDSPWAEELDGARVNRILTLAGFAPDPLLTDPGTVAVLARDVDRQPALGLAQEAAEDGGGIVWQDTAGRIRYADALHRRGAPVAFEFEACDVGLGLGWEQSLEGLTNKVVLRYGPTPEGGEQPEVYQSDAVSIADRGEFGASLSTRIATVDDAQKRADTIIARAANPSWLLGGLEVNLELLDAAELELLLGLDVHALVNVTGMPEGSPATTAALWVEGWRETIEGTDAGLVAWSLAFATSDYCRTAGAPRWDDTPSSATWDTVDPALTWNGAYCMPPSLQRGRWNDVPASMRWDTVSPLMTWDNWPT